VLKSIAAFLILQTQNKFVYQVGSRISKTNLKQYLEGTYNDYVDIDSSIHIRNISQKPIEFCHHVLSGIQLIITELILIALSMIAILLFNATLFLLLFAILMPAIILISFYTKRKLKTVRAHIKASADKAIQHLQEALSGFIESNIYEKNNFFIHRYTTYQDTLNKYLSELQTSQALPARWIEMFAVLGLFVLIWLNKTTGMDATIEIVTVAAFMAAAYKIIPGIVKIMNTAGQVKTYQYTLTGMGSYKQPPAENVKNISQKIRSIRFDNVSFAYHEKPLIERFSARMEAGSLIGLSGASGRGKSTLVNLMLGFLEPAGGSILFNEEETTSETRRHYFRKIAYAKQQAFLIHDTLVKNIILDDDGYDHPKFHDAARFAGLEHFLGNSPDEYHKQITENGRNISGGQRQRIALARAIYKDADLIILDEPFNELDEESENMIFNHCKKLTQKGKLILLITHNTAILSHCNQIISLHAEP